MSIAASSLRKDKPRSCLSGLDLDVKAGNLCQIANCRWVTRNITAVKDIEGERLHQHADCDRENGWWYTPSGDKVRIT